MNALIHTYARAGTAVKLIAQLEDLIQSGKLEPGAQLPPVRELAKRVGVSPNTAASAYQALRQRGLVASDGRRGTRILPRPSQREYAEPPAPPRALDLRVANPDLALLPDLSSIVARLDPRPGDYRSPYPEPALLAAMRAQLASEDLPSEHLLVTSGAIPALYRAVEAWGAPGDKIAVEDPGFNEHRACVDTLGRTAVPMEIDDHGVLPGALRAALRAGATAVVLTPRQQSPTGAEMSRSRAAELREILAGAPEVGVAIDDYASLLSEGPLPPVLPRKARRFLLVRSFNKPFGPGLRVAVSTCDAETLGRIERGQWLSQGGVSVYAQRIAAAALTDRKVQAQLVRARRVYQERREALLEALRERGLPAQGASGLHVWLPVEDEGAVVASLQARGFYLRSGARYRMRSLPAVRITTARLLPADAVRLADVLAGVVQPGGERSP